MGGNGDPFDVQSDGIPPTDESPKYIDERDTGEQYLGITDLDFTDAVDMAPTGAADNMYVSQQRPPGQIPTYVGRHKGAARDLTFDKILYPIYKKVSDDTFDMRLPDLIEFAQVDFEAGNWDAGYAKLADAQSKLEAQASRPGAHPVFEGLVKRIDRAVKRLEKIQANQSQPDTPEDFFKGLTSTKDATTEEDPPMDDYVFQGFQIVVENSAGSSRHWEDRDDKAGETKMQNDYGYIEGYHGVDGDEVDVYMGTSEDAEFVYVIHQLALPEFTEHDEDKVMLGFDSEDEAKEAYLAHYDKPDFYGGMSAMPVDDFRKSLEANASEEDPSAITHPAGKTATHPIFDQADVEEWEFEIEIPPQDWDGDEPWIGDPTAIQETLVDNIDYGTSDGGYYDKDKDAIVVDIEVYDGMYDVEELREMFEKRFKTNVKVFKGWTYRPTARGQPKREPGALPKQKVVAPSDDAEDFFKDLMAVSKRPTNIHTFDELNEFIESIAKPLEPTHFADKIREAAKFNNTNGKEMLKKLDELWYLIVDVMTDHSDPSLTQQLQPGFEDKLDVASDKLMDAKSIGDFVVEQEYLNSLPPFDIASLPPGEHDINVVDYHYGPRTVTLTKDPKYHDDLVDEETGEVYDTSMLRGATVDGPEDFFKGLMS